MPSNLVKTPEDEAHWKAAKEKAAEEGHAEECPYVVAIYEKMRGSKVKKSLGLRKSIDAKPETGYRALADSPEVPAQTVYDYLRQNYPARTLKWVKDATWLKANNVPLEIIRMARRPGGRNMAKVEAIASAIKADKKMEPVVLVETSDGLEIADGYHRTLAYQRAGRKKIRAYVGVGAKEHGPWEEDMHREKLNKAVRKPSPSSNPRRDTRGDAVDAAHAEAGRDSENPAVKIIEGPKGAVFVCGMDWDAHYYFVPKNGGKPHRVLWYDDAEGEPSGGDAKILAAAKTHRNRMNQRVWLPLVGGSLNKALGASDKASPPPAVKSAYETAYRKFHDEAPDEEPRWSKRASGPLGDAWRSSDGWGEFYFLCRKGKVTKVASRMADVMAYHFDEPLRAFAKRDGITRANFKDRLSFGDGKWDGLMQRFVDDRPKGEVNKSYLRGLSVPETDDEEYNGKQAPRLGLRREKPSQQLGLFYKPNDDEDEDATDEERDGMLPGAEQAGKRLVLRKAQTDMFGRKHNIGVRAQSMFDALPEPDKETKAQRRERKDRKASQDHPAQLSLVGKTEREDPNRVDMEKKYPGGKWVTIRGNHVYLQANGEPAPETAPAWLRKEEPQGVSESTKQALSSVEERAEKRKKGRKTEGGDYPNLNAAEAAKVPPEQRPHIEAIKRAKEDEEHHCANCGRPVQRYAVLSNGQQVGLNCAGVLCYPEHHEQFLRFRDEKSVLDNPMIRGDLAVNKYHFEDVARQAVSAEVRSLKEHGYDAAPGPDRTYVLYHHSRKEEVRPGKYKEVHSSSVMPVMFRTGEKGHWLAWTTGLEHDMRDESGKRTGQIGYMEYSHRMSRGADNYGDAVASALRQSGATVIDAREDPDWGERLLRESGLAKAVSNGDHWITIGGHGEDGEQHKGGRPVLIDSEGNIKGGKVPKFFHDMNVRDLSNPKQLRLIHRVTKKTLDEHKKKLAEHERSIHSLARHLQEEHDEGRRALREEIRRVTEGEMITPDKSEENRALPAHLKRDPNKAKNKSAIRQRLAERGVKLSGSWTLDAVADAMGMSENELRRRIMDLEERHRNRPRFEHFLEQAEDMVRGTEGYQSAANVVHALEDLLSTYKPPRASGRRQKVAKSLHLGLRREEVSKALADEKKSRSRSEASRKAALRRVGEKKPTGNFKKIEEKAAEEYGSEEAGRKVAAAVYWRKARKHMHKGVQSVMYGAPKLGLKKGYDERTPMGGELPEVPTVDLVTRPLAAYVALLGEGLSPESVYAQMQSGEPYPQPEWFGGLNKEMAAFGARLIQEGLPMPEVVVGPGWTLSRLAKYGAAITPGLSKSIRMQPEKVSKHAEDIERRAGREESTRAKIHGIWRDLHATEHTRPESEHERLHHEAHRLAGEARVLLPRVQGCRHCAGGH